MYIRGCMLGRHSILHRPSRTTPIIDLFFISPIIDLKWLTEYIFAYKYLRVITMSWPTTKNCWSCTCAYHFYCQDKNRDCLHIISIAQTRMRDCRRFKNISTDHACLWQWDATGTRGSFYREHNLGRSNWLAGRWPRIGCCMLHHTVHAWLSHRPCFCFPIRLVRIKTILKYNSTPMTMLRYISIAHYH